MIPLLFLLFQFVCFCYYVYYYSSFPFWFLFFLFSFSFFFLFPFLLFLLVLLVPVAQQHQEKKNERGPRWKKEKPAFPQGKCGHRHHLLLGSHGGPLGRAKPGKAENATSFCGCVTEPHWHALFEFVSFRTKFSQVS